MKKSLYFFAMIFSAFYLKGQPANCIFKQPQIVINFGAGNVSDLNTEALFNYRRVGSYCPTDGHYSYTPYTSDCFRGDWLTLPEDHTPGDAAGNMMLVNASPYSGTFLKTTITGLKKGTIYEFAVWMMNVCRITDKCPYPLLPNIFIMLQTPDGKVVMQFGAGELVRHNAAEWTQYRAFFTSPLAETTLTLTMIDTNPGGCGNDFALDDITFRECVKVTPKPVVTPARKVPAITKQQHPPPKPILKRKTSEPVKKQLQVSQIAKPSIDSPRQPVAVIKQKPIVFPDPPPLLTTRANPLIKQIETEAGEIRINLYDNGEIDGDSISLYHNNVLLMTHVRLSDKATSFHIAIDAAHPHHELILVAENLGSIPPNTSLMVITAGTKRYEVFISSTEQKNAKVIFDLKE